VREIGLNPTQGGVFTSLLNAKASFRGGGKMMLKTHSSLDMTRESGCYRLSTRGRLRMDGWNILPLVPRMRV
jgi:hypothetical protein